MGELLEEVDEMLGVIFSIFPELYKEGSWLLLLIEAAGALFMLFVIFLICVLFEEVAKGVFAVDFFGICFLIAGSVDEGELRKRILGLMIVLLISFFITFSVLISHQEGESLLVVFLGGLWDGSLNIILLAACLSIVMLPLALFASRRGDRYSRW